MNLSVSSRTLIFIFAEVFLRLSVPAKSQYTSDEVPVQVDSKSDFVVKFKGEVISLRNISKLLRQHNITPPDETMFFKEVHKQKNSAAQSCERRCFLGEIRMYKSCYCDKACKTFGDCCLDFYSRCHQTPNDSPLGNVECGDVDSLFWSSGVIMASTCSSYNSQSTKDCHSVQRLNMTLQKELPVFGWKHNKTYRSIACARCNNEGNTSFWGLDISCKTTSGQGPAQNITAVKKFLKEHDDCSWKYAPTPDLEKHYKSCVIHDSRCASSKLRVLAVVRELCASYAMAFKVDGGRNRYRNPHCAFCNPEGRLNTPNGNRPWGPPLRILLDVSTNIKEPTEPTEPTETLQSTIHTVPLGEGHNLTSQVLNCTSTNCTVTFGGKTCQLFTSAKNQSNQVKFSSNKSFVMVTTNQISYDHKAIKLQGNTVYMLCLEQQTRKIDWYKNSDESESPVLSYITSTAMLLSIASLCFLLVVYLSFKELKNLPGKCVINLSVALLCYQAIFLSARKSTEVDALCKAVAIFLHLFILSTFTWMSVMAFDAANTFTTKVTDTRRQPSDIKKTFIKYCIVGWGLPAVVVGLCSVLDFTGSFHIGYGNSVYCWISDKIALIVAMVTPVSVALVFNIICLTKNIYAIHHLQQAANMAASNSSRASLTLICIKLTTVMGLTWILALAANWKQAEFLHYPSAVFNSMQGFFITLCFVTTKRARGLLKESFSKRRNRAVEPQASTARDQRTGITDVERVSGSSTFTRQ